MATQALEDTGVAGRPREWFNFSNVGELFAKLGVSTVHELRDALWREATTSNGIMGTKYGMLSDNWISPPTTITSPHFEA
ncbi:MAG TPA: hypothetical protein VK607_03220, partial [Kofleriaceae bacterium]|nr:hypothetical protein [Kofleriaceae bacterium]